IAFCKTMRGGQHIALPGLLIIANPGARARAPTLLTIIGRNGNGGSKLPLIGQGYGRAEAGRWIIFAASFFFPGGIQNDHAPAGVAAKQQTQSSQQRADVSEWHTVRLDSAMVRLGVKRR